MVRALAIAIIIVAVVIVAFVLSTGLLMLLWGWVIPDVFAGMVRQQLLPAALTFEQAFKLDIFLAIFVVGSHSSSSSKS